MYRPTWMEIDLDKIEENVRLCKEACGKRIIAVLKADAYGCGDRFVKEAVIDAGCDMIAVSSIDEALVLRAEGYNGPLLILGPSDPLQADLLIKKDIAVTIYSPDFVEKLITRNPRGLKAHLKVDTGMNRIGFKDISALRQAFAALKKAGCVTEGIYTHFCCADSDSALTQKQFARFEEAVKALNHPFDWIHCANSDASFSFHESLSNAVRLGVSLYGVSSFRKDLPHPLSLYSEVAMVKHVSQGETLGYGAAYTSGGDEVIATLPIGYADGFIRANSGRCIYIDGSDVPVVGRVCMDQIMVRLDHEVAPGCKAEIFGEHISLEKMAEELDTIPYEVICLITSRVTRIYMRGGHKIAELNDRLREA